MKDYLSIRGARENNLRNISLKIPKNQLVVITGVSGSGKSSLLFDTIYAEGRRRYLEYLSPKARLSLKKAPKPHVDSIEGISPTLILQESPKFLHPLATVATQTDLWDFLSLLWASIGEQYSPKSGERLIRYTRQEIVQEILSKYPHKAKIQLLSPIALKSFTLQEMVVRLERLGFIRLKILGEDYVSGDPIPEVETQEIDVVVDRIEIKEGIRERLSQSIETCLNLSQGILKVQEGEKIDFFSEIYVSPETGETFLPLTPSDFNFFSNKGACPVCQGKGILLEVSLSLLLKNEEKTLEEVMDEIIQYLSPNERNWVLTVFKVWKEGLKIDRNKPIKELETKILVEWLDGGKVPLETTFPFEGEIRALQTTWKGVKNILRSHLADLKSKSAHFLVPIPCPECHGGRLKAQAEYVLMHGISLPDFAKFTIQEAINLIKIWNFSGKEKKIQEEIVPDIVSRLDTLRKVGLGYLGLDRPLYTLSEGELKRVQLASLIGATLTGLIYALDEPSLGLHPQDTEALIKAMQELKNLGNSVYVVEHSKMIIEEADYLIEIGPEAGSKGGKITFQGELAEALQSSNCITAKFLRGEYQLPLFKKKKKFKKKLSILKASLHNLKDISLDIPLHALVGLAGVSGSGKSTLAIDILGEELSLWLKSHVPPLRLHGFQSIHALNLIQQRAPGISRRSLPATFIGILGEIRYLFSETKLAKARGYSSSYFSLNKRGGRCEVCEGLGKLKIPLSFLPDLEMECDSCYGKRFHEEALQIYWGEYNFSDVLNLSFEVARKIFKNQPLIANKLELVDELGMGYLKLGQDFNTLSNGEIQRLKLIKDLNKKSEGHTLYILDEPSSGLHISDLEKLLKIFYRLIEKGHSVLIIEHHLDLLQSCEWIIEMGPEGGPKGGNIIFEGSFEKLLEQDTPTAKALKKYYLKIV